MTEKSSAGTTSSGNATTWRELAVARSLDSARTRAETRVQRFLDAALELTEGSSGKEFTVQEVVERSGQSLRSFYQYFAGKHELLLALFEESVRSTADHLREAVDTESDPLARLRVFVTEHHKVARPQRASGAARQPGQSGPTPALAEFAQQLLIEHPREAYRAFVPMVTLLEELLKEADEAGYLRAGIDRSRLAGVVLQAVMFNAFGAIISTSSVPPDDDAAAGELWEVLLHGFASAESV